MHLLQSFILLQKRDADKLLISTPTCLAPYLDAKYLKIARDYAHTTFSRMSWNRDEIAAAALVAISLYFGSKLSLNGNTASSVGQKAPTFGSVVQPDIEESK